MPWFPLGGGGGSSVGFVKAQRTAGNVSLTSTAIADVDTGIDLVISAVEGDLLQVELSAFLDSQAQFVNFDVYTIVAGAPVNPLGPGLSASLAGANGVQAWRVSNAAAQWPLSGGPSPYTVQAGDLSAGTVRLRLRYAKNTATARTIFATTAAPLSWWVKNYGQ